MNNEYEQKHISQDDKSSECLQKCAFLVYSVLIFGINHIKNFKVKGFKVLLHYLFGSKKLRRISKKVNLVKSVTEFLIKVWKILVMKQGVGGIMYEGLVLRDVVDMSAVTNIDGREDS